MRVAFIAALVLLSGSVSADCIGTDNFKTCYDDSGNTYTVQKFGNSTYVNGQNPSTGSSWNQQSQRIGDYIVIESASRQRTAKEYKDPLGPFGPVCDVIEVQLVQLLKIHLPSLAASSVAEALATRNIIEN